MGQQQLLLIVLGVIIVGIAVVVGINLFNANAEESTKDTLISEGVNLGAMAQQYYKKPLAMGGGGNSFVGFETRVPENLRHTPAGEWEIHNGTATDITFTGDPRDYDDWTVEVRVTKDSISAKVEGATP